MFFTGAVGATYLALAGMWILAKLPAEPGGGGSRIGRDSVGAFAVDHAMVLEPGIVWVGGANFTAYHQQLARRYLEAYLHLASASYVLKPSVVSPKAHVCEAGAVCEIPLSTIYVPGRGPSHGTRKPVAPPPDMELFANRTMRFRGPARAYVWSKQILLVLSGTRHPRRGAPKHHHVTTELKLPSGLSDSIYGLAMERL